MNSAIYMLYILAIRFFYGASYAIPAAVLCINRRLYLLASPTSVLPSQADKRREFIIDLVIGIGLPIVEMILCLSFNYFFYYISLAHSYHKVFFAQDARFQIFEDNGCYPLLTATWVSIAIAFVPLILLQLISGVYGCLSIRAFYKHRSKLRDSECSISRNLNQNRYIRLMVFSACDLLVGAPLTVFYLYGGLPLFPFRGITEKDHTRVRQVPAVLWRATTIRELNVELMRWIMVLCAFVYFAIFGFTQESRNNYRAALRSVVQVFIMITGIKTRPSSKAEECVLLIFSLSLPVFHLIYQIF